MFSFLLEATENEPSSIELFLSTLAILVAAGSVIVAIVFGVLQKNHNKNSVRPIAFINLGDYENLIFVELKNAGTGPLIVEEMRCYSNNEESPILLNLLPTPKQMWDTFIDENISDYVIPVNGLLTLIKISPHSAITRNNLRHALSEITIELKYKDIYNKQFSYRRTMEFYRNRLEEVAVTRSVVID